MGGLEACHATTTVTGAESKSSDKVHGDLLMAKSWETKPWVWFAIVVGAGITTAVVSNALSKWWGLMKLQQKNLASVQAQATPNQGKYQVAY